jgi:hypothetical protein
VSADGTLGGRGPQAMVETDLARELTDEECAALRWSVRHERWVHGDWCETCGWAIERDEDACVDCPVRASMRDEVITP